MKRSCLLVAIFLFLNQYSFGQAIPRFNPDTILSVVIDSVVVIKTAKSGLNQEDFIERIINDTSFYEAFRAMKKYKFLAENSIYSYDKKNKVNGRIYRKFIHNPNKSAQKITYLADKSEGNLHKKSGKYRLKTIEMFDYIFVNAYQSYYSPSSSSGPANKGGEKNESYKDKLKTLIFSPGRPVKGIPIISGKTEIFSANMRQYYDYRFYSGTYLDSIPVYRFKVTLKDDLSGWTKDGLMIKELTTIFDKRNFQILGRYIDMKLDNLAFSFDIQMNIEMSYFMDELLPTKISYQGNWDIPFKSEERASFLISHKNYTEK